MIIGGKFGIVEGVSTVRDWEITETEAQPKGVASNSGQGTFRRPGVRSWTGSYGSYGGVPPKMPGEMFDFRGYAGPASGVAGTSGPMYIGKAMIADVTIEWDWKTAQIIQTKSTFQGHLDLQKASNPPVLDVSIIDDPSTIPAKITWDTAAPSGVQLFDCITKASLKITNAVQSYVNSCTVLGDFPNQIAWTGRVSGPIDWSLSISQENADTAAADPKIGSIIQIKMYLDATRFWDLQYGIVKDYSGYKVNRETGAIIDRTIAVDMMCHDGAGVLGHIAKPDTSIWWPFTPAG